MSASHLLIINPRSANGSTGRKWPKMEAYLRTLLPAFDAVLTNAPGDATRIAAGARGQYEVVVAVGGDGTTNEVVNGLVDGDERSGPGIALGVLPGGTGSDFLRGLGIPRSLDGAAAVLARGKQRLIDVGRARFLGPDGAQATRYFINAAEVGMGAVVCRALDRSPRRFGGAFAFLWAIMVTMIKYRDCPVSLSVDGAAAETVVLNNAWIANGAYSGAGIRSAPRARMDDGLLDVVRLEHAGLLRRIRGLFKVRSGAFVDLPHVDYRVVHRLEATAETAVPVETDGDPVGSVPASFDLLPARLSVIS